jgi:hypothetical protein
VGAPFLVVGCCQRSNEVEDDPLVVELGGGLLLDHGPPVRVFTYDAGAEVAAALP